MYSWFGRKAPAPATNGLTQNGANAALVKALHNVANVKLRNALNKAKAAANAAKNGTIAERNKTIAELQAALKEAKPVVTAAANVAPNKPVEPATQNAENQAVNAVARNAAALADFNARIAAANNTNKLTQVGVNVKVYATKHGIQLNRTNVKQRLNAINVRKLFVPQINS
jgi:hypothetical protein